MPCDYSKYHPEWRTRIRPDILERAEDCCENCGLRNHRIIFRSKKNKAICFVQPMHLDLKNEKEVYHKHYGKFFKSIWSPPIKIVLTISHTDHDIEHNEYSNLRALCQRCHLLHDKDQHAKSRI